MKQNIAGVILWLFRFTTAITAVIMAVSFTMPWWHIQLSGSSGFGTIRIYAYGLEPVASMNIIMQYLVNDITPLYQTILAWLFLSLSIIAVMCSTWLKGKLGTLLLGGAGISFITCALVAVFVVIANRAAEFNVPLQDTTSLTDGSSNVNVRTWLGAGSYLAYTAGGLCLIQSLLWEVISRGSNI
jgi:hypothetical protein